MKHYDFLVIGSGPAGQKAAIQAIKFGKRAAVIERRAVIGGVAVHTGTIPSKTIVHIASLKYEVAHWQDALHSFPVM